MPAPVGGGHGGRGEADELDGQQVGRAGGALDDVVDVGSGRAGLLAGPEQGRLLGRADDHGLAALLGLEAEGDGRGVDEPEDGHANGQQGHDHRGDQQDVAEAGHPELLAEGGLAGRADAGHDRVALLLGDGRQLGRPGAGVVGTEPAGQTLQLTAAGSSGSRWRWTWLRRLGICPAR